MKRNSTSGFFRRTIFLSLFLLLILTACSGDFPAPQDKEIQAAATAAARSTPTPSPHPTATKTLAVTRTQTAIPTFTQNPSPSPTVTLTPTAVPFGVAAQLEVFNELWLSVRNGYLYPDFNGVDWEAVYYEFLARIETGLTPMAFYRAMDEMVLRLGDDHSFYLDPTQVVEEDAIYFGDQSYVGIGVILVTVPERNRAVVLVTGSGGPAERAGVHPRDWVLAVDGIPLVSENGLLRDLIRGPLHSTLRLTVQTPGAAPREVTLLREQISGGYQVLYQVLDGPGGRRIGYILIPSFSVEDFDEQIGDALREMTAAGSLAGLVLDNRWNRGGTNTVLEGSLAYFVNGLLGSFVNNADSRPLLVRGKNVGGSQNVPLVVLTGLDTASFGEVFAGILQDVERATLVGATTRGNVETLWGYDFEDGSRAWIAHDTFRPLNHPEMDWEQTGVHPDILVEGAWEEFNLTLDPVVQAAVEVLTR